MKSMFFPAVLAAALLVSPIAARAGETPLPPDSVTVSLAAEGWVEAAKPRVNIAIDSALAGGEVGALRGELKGTLAKLVPDAAWHITQFNRSADQAGLERWHLEAEARVNETALDGIYDRAKKLSRPGAQVSVRAVDFSPTVAERETVVADLRAKIYAMTKDEIARLASVYPDRSFRLRDVTFSTQGPPHPIPAMKTMRAGAVMPEMAAPSGIGVSEYIELYATAVLAAEPPARE